MSLGQQISENSSPSAASRRSLEFHWTWLRVREQMIRGLLFLCAALSIATTLGITAILVTEAFAFFQAVSPFVFFTDTRWTPLSLDKHFGIMPLACGTFLVAGISALIGLPIGLAAALYLSEYATPRQRNWLKPVLEILAGIPSIVFGYFALVFVTPYFIRPLFQNLLGIPVDLYNVLSAGIVVGIMIIPTVASLSEDVLRSVPRGLREAGYAIGSTKFDVCVRIVLPAALSGILASFLLAISRAIGETMAVVIAAGNRPQLTLNVLTSVETMTAYIANVILGDSPAGTIEYQSLYAVALTLFVITLAMNVLAQFILRRYRNVYQ